MYVADRLVNCARTLTRVSVTARPLGAKRKHHQQGLFGSLSTQVTGPSEHF